MNPDPVVELDSACEWLRLADDVLTAAAGRPMTAAPGRAHLQAMAGCLRRNPGIAAVIAADMTHAGAQRPATP